MAGQPAFDPRRKATFSCTGCNYKVRVSYSESTYEWAKKIIERHTQKRHGTKPNLIVKDDAENPILLPGS